ncbi:MAG: outer membrane lipoprotein-sorting protein [Planctomycetes bacterium]|nr:outer membrane lipoprotein-sorting protein [Planctomycetota bacterium]
MRQTDKIDNLIKNLKTTASFELDQRIDALIDPSKTIHSQPLKPWSIIMKNPITKISAAAMVFVAVILGLNSIPGSKSNQLFANVMNNVLKANSVSYKWTIQKNDQKSEYTCMINDLYVKRTVVGGRDIQLHDFKTGSHLHLFAGGPGGKACYAELTRKIGNNKSKHPFAYLDWISKMHKIDAQYVGTEEFEGLQYKMYSRKFPYEETKIWVDLDTDLPFRIVIESYPNKEKNIKPLRVVLRESDFGGSDEYTRSATVRGGKSNGIQKRKTEIYSDFQWNVELEDSLFSMEAPDNYTVKEKRVDDARQAGRNWIVEALSFWTEMSDGQFPDDILDMAKQEKVVPLLIKKFDKNGDPREEMDRACEQMVALLQSVEFAMHSIGEDNWSYQGKGIKFGASDTPICWWQKGDIPDSPYTVIYGDLSKVIVESPPQSD